MEKDDKCVVIVIDPGDGAAEFAVHVLKPGAFDVTKFSLRTQSPRQTVENAVETGGQNQKKKIFWSDVLARLSSLTKRERQVLDLIIAGQSSKLIAHNLCISSKTVEFHRAHILNKMAVRTSLELVGTVVAATTTRDVYGLGSEEHGHLPGYGTVGK